MCEQKTKTIEMKIDSSDKRQIFTQIRNSVIDAALQRLARNSGWLLAAEGVALIVSVLPISSSSSPAWYRRLW